MEADVAGWVGVAGGPNQILPAGEVPKGTAMPFYHLGGSQFISTMSEFCNIGTVESLISENPIRGKNLCLMLSCFRCNKHIRRA